MAVETTSEGAAPVPAAPGGIRAVGRALLRPAVPLTVFALLAVASLVQKSATYDEAVLLASGAWYLRTGDARVNAENPPLLKAFYALPTLVLGYKAVPAPESARESYRMHNGLEYGNQALYAQPYPRLILNACRTMVVLLAAGLGLLLYQVARRRWDATTAGLLLWVFALAPNLLAHARLFTPDIGCTFFVFAFTVALYRLLTGNRRLDVWLAGASLGGALLAKFTCVLLLPILVVQVGLYLTLTRRWREWRPVALRLAATGVIALFVVNAFYGFSEPLRPLSAAEYRSPLVQKLQMVPGLRSLPLPIPALYVRGFDIVAYNNKPGFPAVFLGEVYPRGGSWWYYYLVALGLKVPIPLLIALALGAAMLARERPRDPAAVALFALPPLLLFLNFSLVAYRQLGVRYILPLWPFLILLVGFAVDAARRQGTRPARLAMAALGAWFAAESLLAFPNYLAYFNEFAGGSRNGWRYLAAADVDWGEDLPALARWQRRHGDPAMYVLYYGVAPLEAYGVRAVEWGKLPFPPYMAISVTNYYLCYKIPLVTYLRQHREPVARLGNSIHVYALDESVTREFIARAEAAAQGEGGEAAPAPAESAPP